MTLEQLRAFDAVIRSGSIRAASQQLHKSAPSISSAIKSLESHLELKLFSREGYRLILTADGRNFYDKVQQILVSVTELNAFSRQKWKKQAQKLAIAVDAFVSVQQLISVVESVSAVFPDVQLNLSVEHFGGALDKLHDGRADLAVTPLVGHTCAEIEFKYLFSVPIIPVARSDSKVAAIPSPVRQSDLVEEKQIVLADGAKTESWRCGNMINGTKKHCVSDLNTKKSLIMAGVGWGGLPEHLVHTEMASGRLTQLQLEGYKRLYAEHYLVRRTDCEHDMVAQKAWELIAGHEPAVPPLNMISTLEPRTGIN